jgi:hypothetical protein
MFNFKKSKRSYILERREYSFKDTCCSCRCVTRDRLERAYIWTGMSTSRTMHMHQRVLLSTRTARAFLLPADYCYTSSANKLTTPSILNQIVLANLYV